MVKNEIKKKYLVIYICLFLVSGILFIFRLLNWIDPKVKLLPNFLLVHITNLTLSFMVLLALGFTVFVFGGKMKTITVAALLIAAFNIGYELIFPIMNVPDIADTLFGLAGIVSAYAFLLSLKKNGLVSK